MQVEGERGNRVVSGSSKANSSHCNAAAGRSVLGLVPSMHVYAGPGVYRLGLLNKGRRMQGTTTGAIVEDKLPIFCSSAIVASEQFELICQFGIS